MGLGWNLLKGALLRHGDHDIVYGSIAELSQSATYPSPG